MSTSHTLAPVHPVLLVTIRFKRRLIMPNEFTVRLASTDFGDTFTVEKLIEEGLTKWTSGNLLPTFGFFTSFTRRILSYGKYIGYNSSNVIAVYTEKDKGRISLKDVARHVLVNNETIVVEYYDRSVCLSVLALGVSGLAYLFYKGRNYIHYRMHKSQLSIRN
jgi:hypothetical protein